MILRNKLGKKGKTSKTKDITLNEILQRRQKIQNWNNKEISVNSAWIVNFKKYKDHKDISAIFYFF